jgi:hypothetical protein
MQGDGLAIVALNQLHREVHARLRARRGRQSAILRRPELWRRHDRLDRSANRRQPGMAAPLLGLLISFQSADQADQFPMCSRVRVLQLIEAMRIRQAAEIDEHANPLPPRLLQVR